LLFATYSIFEIPSNLILYRVGARRWIARIMITWGIVAAANAFVVGPTSFYVVRLLLGAAEAGFFPGITFFLTSWFPRYYRARVLAWFLVAIPVSSVIGGPISGLLLQMHGVLGLAGWQWMFIVEGLPASIIGIFILFVLSDHPENAGWLNLDERAAIAAMFAEEQRDRARHSLISALKDVRVLILTIIQFAYTLGSYGIGIWLPQILKTHGLSNVAVGFVSAVPYLFASVAMLIWAAYVDRAGQKIAHLTLGFLWELSALSCPSDGRNWRQV
jgi:MFS transporter, ACS family, tartrate transporter